MLVFVLHNKIFTILSRFGEYDSYILQNLVLVSNSDSYLVGLYHLNTEV